MSTANIEQIVPIAGGLGGVAVVFSTHGEGTRIYLYDFPDSFRIMAGDDPVFYDAIEVAEIPGASFGIPGFGTLESVTSSLEDVSTTIETAAAIGALLFP